MLTSLEKSAPSFSKTKLLAKRGLSMERRHTIQIPCNSYSKGSPACNTTNPLLVLHGHQKENTPVLSEMETRDICCLPNVRLIAENADMDNSALKAESSDFRNLERGMDAGYHPMYSLNRKPSAFPEIKRKQAIQRRHTLSVITEVDASEIVSVSSRRSRQKENPLPQIGQHEIHNSHKKLVRYAERQPMSCKRVGEVPNKHDRSQVLQKHLQRAEGRYQNEQEIKAVRLYEWLKDQTDTHAIRLAR